MLYVFMGQSCTGKSTVVDKVKEIIDVEVFSGKDYLKMAKSENEAWKIFYEKLSTAASSKESSGANIAYLITEKDQLDRINEIEGILKVKFTASLDTIKERFSQRLRGNMPQAIENMIERQYNEWDSIIGDINIDTTDNSSAEEIANSIINISI